MSSASCGATGVQDRISKELGALDRGRSPSCPPCADGDFTASSKQAHFPTAVASDHLRSSSYGASANLARSRHSGATAEKRPYLPAELLCDMEMQKVRQSRAFVVSLRNRTDHLPQRQISMWQVVTDAV
jgi:hypothetical protein